MHCCLTEAFVTVDHSLKFDKLIMKKNIPIIYRAPMIVQEMCSRFIGIVNGVCQVVSPSSRINDPIMTFISYTILANDHSELHVLFILLCSLTCN